MEGRFLFFAPAILLEISTFYWLKHRADRYLAAACARASAAREDNGFSATSHSDFPAPRLRRITNSRWDADGHFDLLLAAKGESTGSIVMLSLIRLISD